MKIKGWIRAGLGIVLVVLMGIPVSGAWHTEVADNGGYVGWYTSLALDSQDQPRISYFDLTNQDLKYAWKDTGGWMRMTVDSEGVVGQYTSLALDSQNRMYISYINMSDGSLKYAAWTGVITLDKTGTVGTYTSLALDSHDLPHISYFGPVVEAPRTSETGRARPGTSG